MWSVLTNWKTTVAGILGAVGAYLISQPDPVLHTIGQILVVVAPILLGVAAKDASVSGNGKKP
jgi:hypothetical protein